MINRAVLIGHVGKDPVCKLTAAGRPMVSFSLATRERGRNGQERTDWHQIVAFDATAQYLTQLSTPKYQDRPALFRQGVIAYCEGSIRTEESTDREGRKSYFTRIYASRVTILGPGGTMTEGGTP